MSRTASERFWQYLLIASTLALSWLGMQVAHESGHVVAAWVSREHVRRVVLHPLVISRTDTTHDRHPLAVIWGGPVGGTMIPLLTLGAARSLKLPWAYLVRFFTGVCLVANGAYVGVGAFAGIGDAGDLILHGSPRWVLMLFGISAVPAGLFLWNGLGPRFGLGGETGQVRRRDAVGTLVVLIVVVLVEVLIGRQD